MHPDSGAFERIRIRAQAIALEPVFSDEVGSRARRSKKSIGNDDQLLRELAILIAFSQGAKSARVQCLVESGELDRAFNSFRVEDVGLIEPAQVLKSHWTALGGAFRYRKKVGAIVETARAMQRLRQRGAPLGELLAKVPDRIRTPDDMGRFWSAFDQLRGQLGDVGMPYFNKLTSLLHLLLHFGFDCVKPDSVVQKVAKAEGLLPEKPKDRDLRQLVQSIQSYAIRHDTRPGIIDFYMLVDGRQTWATQFIRPDCVSPVA